MCLACLERTGGVERRPPPWERRAELGLVTAVVQQVKESILKPDTFFRGLPAEGSVKEAMLFAWFMSALAAGPNLLMQRLNFGSLAQSMSTLNRGHPPSWMHALSPWAFAAVLALVPVLLYPLMFFISAGLTHLGCIIWGAGGKGFNATARVSGYSAGPALLAWLPVMGGLLAMYVIVLQVFGIARVHETSIGKAIGGVLTIPLVLGCCIGVGLVAAIMAAVGAAAH